MSTPLDSSPRPESRRYRHHADVVTEAVDGDLLLVHMGRGTAFRLNRTGRAVWDLASAGLTAAEIGLRLHTACGVPLERVEYEAAKLMAELRNSRLLEPRSEQAP